MRAELDSHADTVIAGGAFRVEEYLNIVVPVYPYTTDYTPKHVELVNAVTALDNVDGIVYLLVCNQALHMPDVEPSLLSIPQLRANSVVVDDCPLQYCGRTTHCIYIPEEQVQLPLSLHGVMSYLPVRKPTDKEMTSAHRLELTSTVCWDPHSTDVETTESQYS